MKIALCGPSRCGKDTAAEWLAKNTTLRYWDSTSRVIAHHAAAALGMTEEQAWACRHQYRKVWGDIGDRLRRDDPCKLARTVLANADICAGVRKGTEMRALMAERLVDLAIWIDRPESESDETQEYGPELCDVILRNDSTVPVFLARLEALARTWGVMASS